MRLPILHRLAIPLLLLSLQTAQAEEWAGTVKLASGETHVERDGQRLALKTGDRVYPGDRLITGKEGREEELRSELLKLSAPTRAEPGNLRYDLYQSPVKPNQFMRYEIWRNPQALEDHKLTPHIKASFKLRQEQGWMTEITTWKRVREDRQPAEQARKD